MPLSHWAQCWRHGAGRAVADVDQRHRHALGGPDAEHHHRHQGRLPAGADARPAAVRQVRTSATCSRSGPPEFSLDFFKAIGLAMVAVIWPYDGWINIGPVAEEIREPQRNVPLGLGARHADRDRSSMSARTSSYHLVPADGPESQAPRRWPPTCSQGLLGMPGLWVPLASLA